MKKPSAKNPGRDMTVVLVVVTVDCPLLYLEIVQRVYCRVVLSKEPTAVPVVVARMNLRLHP